MHNIAVPCLHICNIHTCPVHSCTTSCKIHTYTTSCNIHTCTIPIHFNFPHIYNYIYIYMYHCERVYRPWMKNTAWKNKSDWGSDRECFVLATSSTSKGALLKVYTYGDVVWRRSSIPTVRWWNSSKVFHGSPLFNPDRLPAVGFPPPESLSEYRFRWLLRLPGIGDFHHSNGESH